MIDEALAKRVTLLIKKKRARIISPEEFNELITLLDIVAKDKDLPTGLRATTGIVLANAIGKRKPRELSA